MDKGAQQWPHILAGLETEQSPLSGAAPRIHLAGELPPFLAGPPSGCRKHILASCHRSGLCHGIIQGAVGEHRGCGARDTPRHPRVPLGLQPGGPSLCPSRTAARDQSVCGVGGVCAPECTLRLSWAFLCALIFSFPFSFPFFSFLSSISSFSFPHFPSLIPPFFPPTKLQGRAGGTFPIPADPADPQPSTHR